MDFISGRCIQVYEEDEVSWNWDEVWQAVGVIAVITVAALIVTFTLAPKNVDYYYLTKSDGDSGICVTAHWTWRADTRVYCTDDATKALDFTAKANTTLRK